jgi:hypothetical protein
MRISSDRNGTSRCQSSAFTPYARDAGNLDAHCGLHSVGLLGVAASDPGASPVAIAPSGASNTWAAVRRVRRDDQDGDAQSGMEEEGGVERELHIEYCLNMA